MTPQGVGAAGQYIYQRGKSMVIIVMDNTPIILVVPTNDKKVVYVETHK
jgi:hypothetical protein